MSALLTLMHDHPISGHMGQAKTLSRTRQSRFYWRTMSNDAKEWCKRCDLCFRAKAPNRPKASPLKNMPTGAPMERVAMDIMGPLPLTSYNNTVILVISDYFTKWAEFVALPDQRAVTVAEVLVEVIFTRFGVPAELLTDQGPDFTSDVIRELCKLFRSDKIRTSPYRPQTDGQVERLNRTVGRMLRQLVSKRQTDWDEHLPLMAMAYRSSIHSTTGYTPNQLMLGRECASPFNTQEAAPGYETEGPGYPHYVEHLAQKMRRSHSLARENLNAAQARQKRYYDRRARESRFQRGDTVWLYYPVKETGVSRNFNLAGKVPTWLRTESER